MRRRTLSLQIRLTVLLLGLVAAGLPPAQAHASPFGLERFTIEPTERTEERSVESPSGQFGPEFVNQPYAFTQANGRPWALTTTIALASEEVRSEGGAGIISVVPTQDAKDMIVGLPPGLLGDPMATPRCSLTFVTSSTGAQCPADTQIGVYAIEYLGGKKAVAPIVNVVPEKGQSAEFALEEKAHALTPPLLTARLVHTAAGYSFTVASRELPVVGLTRVELTFWGVPADPSHDPMRGVFCSNTGRPQPLQCEGHGERSGAAAVPFLTMPSDCSAGSETATLRADSWEEPGSVGVEGQYSGYLEAHTTFAPASGCGLLRFNPGTGIEVRPDTTRADQPVGLGVDLRVPQSEEAGADATPLLRDTTVTLPEGMSVSPGVVDGVQACNEFGPEGINIRGPESEEVAPDGEWQLAPGHCPAASIVGTAEAITPFLPVPVKGHVYLARPACGGSGQPACTEEDALDGNLYRLYLELGGTGELADTGIQFKVPFQTEANPATGQLTANVRELVQAPYSEVRIHLNGGPRAPIANPASCGAATTTADFTPWSEPGTTAGGLVSTGTPDLLASSSFEVEGCAPTSFSPGFLAGTATPQAGQFSAFTMNLSRSDGEQYVKGVQLHTPPGLLAMLSSVPLCGEPQADQGACPESSKIGTTRVASGAGSHPFEIEGEVYLTGPHDGAPFGLAIVTHAVAGPFNLGLIVVRARIDIDPSNSTATITTDETGPYAVPQIVFGVPLRLKRILVNIDRPGFIFNPTDCNAQQVTGNVSGDGGAVAHPATPFAVGGCKSLAFEPSFKVSTSGHTTRRFGASLDVKLTYPKYEPGSEANVAKVKVELPKQLPANSEALKKACLASVFEANPAACPAAAVVGIAKAITPVLPVPLSGPAYFVSHGGAEFPSLVVVLQGDGVRVDLEGETFISKKTDITSSTFKSVPDVPVETFQLYLPQGPYSALSANGNLCKRKLKMPTEFVAQNGIAVKESTKISVSGCGASAKKSRRHAK